VAFELNLKAIKRISMASSSFQKNKKYHKHIFSPQRNQRQHAVEKGESEGAIMGSWVGAR
jgi:hypothetical protein